MYTCRHSQTDRISWRVNGKTLGVETQPQNVTSGSMPVPGGGTIHSLTIGGITENNGTTIQCSALVTEGDRNDRTLPSVFMIQGRDIVK